MIELKHIKKYYKMGDDIVKALDDVNLKINDGEFVTIVGPSGSGKSTLMNLIGCLDKATSGEYFIDGTEISNYSEKQLAFLRNKKMGFIFQGFNLLQNLSAYENVDLPLIYQGLSLSERKKRVLSSLELVGMKERMKHKPNELSGGQQQRVAIARALATRPMCILADEPTGNLDSVTGDEIMKILKKLNESGTTVIIITHNDEIAKFSRRIIRIYDGKIESDVVNEDIKSYGKIYDEIESKNNINSENVDNLLSNKENSVQNSSENSLEIESSTNETEIIDLSGDEKLQNLNSQENFIDNNIEDFREEKKIKKPKVVKKKEQSQDNKVLIKSKKTTNKGEQ